MNAPDPNPTLSHAPPSGDEPPFAPAAPTETFDPSRTTGLPPTPPAESPEFPGYEILNEIARGGMGVVFAARDLSLGCEVAVKTLLPGADPKRFESEARVTAHLPHPNIPPVHQLGSTPDGRPLLAFAHHNVGLALAKKGDADGAVTAYRAAVAADPKFARGHNTLGAALFRGGDVPGAVTAFRAAVAHEPKNVPYHSNLGNALAKAGDTDGALDAFRAVAKLDPKNAVAWNNVGALLHGRRDYAGAVAAFERASSLQPDSAKFRTSLALAKKLLADQQDRTAPPPRSVSP